MDTAFLQQLETLHKKNQYKKIVDAIESLPKSAQDTNLMGLLARAYCNLAEYDHALELLFAASQPDDFIWNFRVGFAYYFSLRPSEALPYFEQAFLRNPTPEIADYMTRCRTAKFANKSLSCIRATKYNPSHNRMQEKPKSTSAAAKPPILDDPLTMEESSTPENPAVIQYLPCDLEAVQAHIEQQFGSIAAILPFTSGRSMNIQLCVCPPTATRNYYTVCTLGMGALPMQIPKEQRTQIPARLELMLTLPADWEFDLSDNQWFWPLRWLLVTAYIPFDQNTWVSTGHSLSTSAENTPFDPSTKQSCVLVTELQDQPKSAAACTLPDGETVRFLQVLSLYPEELTYKTQYGTRALLRQMSNTGHIIRPYRLNTCTSDLLFPRTNPSPFVC